MIGDEPGDTDSDPDASEEAVPKSEGRAGLPFISSLRQDIQGRHSEPCICTGKVQSGRAGSDKEGRAVRTETTIHNTRDFGIGRVCREVSTKHANPRAVSSAG